ncbi:MAG: tRNA (adenosine(37)-N6)-dimethylallyltransferase MiaA [Proteobacteria bacterium]|nr:MAG: tRNA (adenosine(37)-N6)-dimethylallyltransferase MiaA [Pseudomonadota bacterium]
MKNKAVFLAGPTAGGKSALALALAERAGGVIINADSMQVYRELRVVTARPSPEEEARVPHRLYGYRAASDVSSAAAWSADATAALTEAWAAGRLPIVIGGSGLYLRTLLYGIAPIPDVPADLRQSVRSRMATEGPEALHRELTKLDPETAVKLTPGDRQRIARALEVALATGEPLSAWQRRPPEGGLLPGIDALLLVLAPPRDVLYERCDRRLAQMMAEGGLAEIRAFLAANPPPDVPLRRALAVPEFSRHLAGELGFDEALRLAQTATRQYAKRQMTWFRHQFSDWPSGDEQFLKRLLSEKFPFIRF